MILFICFIACASFAQQYYNEWIDYSKTYYKFKIAVNGLYRINQNNLPSALLNTPAEQFQLWRNGKEIPLYTSVASGVLQAGGYIEFWGEKNDGLPDKNLYKNPNNQLSANLSLETDTAAYFLTVNTGTNLRINDAANNVSGTTLTADPYFIYHYHYDYQKTINRGRAVYYGTDVYSSTYDQGEWWCSGDFYPNIPLKLNAGNLYAANAAITPKLNVSIAGTSIVNGANRTINVAVNGSTAINTTSILNMDAGILSADLTNTQINTASTNFVFSDINTLINDHITVGFVDVEYARQFNFGGSANFKFELAATTTGNYIKISNFLNGSIAPVLYDLTNNKRYIANTGTAGIFQFVLPPSAVSRNLVLVSEDASNVHAINSFATRNFTNYALTANQSDYIIISNKILGIGAGQPVDQYKQYRSSAAGGSYNTRIYDIDDLVDEFGYGIKQHPLSVKNFLRYARNTFSVAPKFAFLIGKGCYI